MHAHSGQKWPDNFDEISEAKAKLEKSLKKKYYSEYHQQSSKTIISRGSILLAGEVADKHLQGLTLLNLTAAWQF